MTDARIILRPARNPHPDRPELPERDYVLTAPLDEEGRIDPIAFKRQRWPVRRFHDGEETEIGWLAHRGSQWFIDYDKRTSEDDEPIFRLGEHRFRVGEYVTITDRDGEEETFRVASAEPLIAAA